MTNHRFVYKKYLKFTPRIISQSRYSQISSAIYNTIFTTLQHELLKQLLRLAHNCLTFDFIGTSTDESSDDLCTVQVFIKISLYKLELFYDLYVETRIYRVFPILHYRFQLVGVQRFLSSVHFNCFSIYMEPYQQHCK